MNCLPLYEPPPVEGREEQDLDSADTPSNSPKKQSPHGRKFSLIKARSQEALDTVAAELELHDHDYTNYKSDSESFSKTVAVAPKKWSRISASYSKNFRVMVHSVDEPQRSGPAINPQESVVSSVPAVNPEDSSVPAANPEESSVPAANPEESSVPAANPEESSVPAVNPEENRVPAMNPEKSSDPTVIPAANSSITAVNSEESRVKGESTMPVINVRESSIPAEEKSGPANPEENSVPVNNEQEGKESTGSEGHAVSPQREMEPAETEIANEEAPINVMEKRDGELEVEERGNAIKEDEKEEGVDAVTQKPLYQETSSEISSDFTEPRTLRSSRKKQKKKSLRYVKSSSPTSEVENGSEGEGEKGLTVNYLDSKTMSTLKRSSGSVSFYYRTTKHPASPLSMETSVEEDGFEQEELSAAKPQFVVEETGEALSQEDATSPSALSEQASQLGLSASHPPIISVLIPSLLPVIPPTLDQEYVQRSGWLNKLSHRKGVFGDKWQKRYFCLHRSWLYYFKKYGVSGTLHVCLLGPVKVS